MTIDQVGRTLEAAMRTISGRDASAATAAFNASESSRLADTFTR